MKSLRLALAVSLFVCAAHAAVLPATPSTFSAVFTKLPAAGGDTVALAPGIYGRLDLGRKFAAPVTVTCADPLQRPIAPGFYIGGASNVTLSCLDVDWPPTIASTDSTPATEVSGSDHIVLTDLKIIGGPAISGVSEDHVGYTDASGNVIGRPTGYGLAIRGSSDVSVSATEVARFHKGVVLQGTQRVLLQRLNVHDTRTTPIVGSNNVDLTVTDSDLHDTAPWAWGLKTPTGVSYGDHGDFLALWSDAGQTTPNARIKITGNRMIQSKGVPILGMWLEGSAAAPFTDFEIRDNLIVTNNLQGIGPLNFAVRGVITGNTLRRTDGSGDAGQSPTILPRGGSTGLTITGNSLGAPVDDKSGGANTVASNTVLSGAANIYAAVSAPITRPAVVLPAVVVAADPRDAQIVDLTAKLKAANDNLATATATISALQGQAITSAMALKTAQDSQKATQAALDAELAAAAALRTSLAAIQSQAAAALAK